MASAIYDVVTEVLRGRRPGEREMQRAIAEPIARWERVLGFDGCAVQLDRALHRAGLSAAAPAPLRRLLREATSESLRRALLVHSQLDELAVVAAREGIRVMALKGAGRLLGGELAGTRSIADIDILATPHDAARLRQLLQRECGYSVGGAAYPHHLAGLTRPGSLGIELHVRLTEDVLPLDAAMWEETRIVTVGGSPIELPSPTCMLLHTIEHAVRVNWTARYRLRDVLDVAALATADVDRARVEAYVASSECRRPMRTLLAAAGSLEPSDPRMGSRAWRTVRRVGRARIAFAARPGAPLIAERWFRWVGVAAEGSPRTMGRLGLDLARRLAMRGAGVVVLMLGGVACNGPVAPPPLVVTPFIFASREGGSWALYGYRDGAVTLLSSVGAGDREPNSVGARVVFTSLRDGDAEIYSAVLDSDFRLGAQTRLTREYGNDTEPALSPSGTTIAFVSARSGTPRIWLMDVTGANPRALETGSPAYVPEASPRWSPTGDGIVFTSTRTGISQVYAVPAGGGSATQLSRESRGAFQPSWLPDGRAVLYTAVTGGGQLLVVPAAGGDATPFSADSGAIGDAACNPRFCLAVDGPLGTSGHIVVLTASGRRTGKILPQVADDHSPALLRP